MEDAAKSDEACWGRTAGSWAASKALKDQRLLGETPGEFAGEVKGGGLLLLGWPHRQGQHPLACRDQKIQGWVSWA